MVEIGNFFETSVDALLGYGWETMSMGQAAEKLRLYIVDKNLAEGMRFAEKALQKYPNSFQVVMRSAGVYFLSMESEHCTRAVELYQKALQLIDQNTDETIGTTTIQNRIALCYCYMGRMDDAIALLKQNNVGGMNNFQIGLLLSHNDKEVEEALKYLSEALGSCYSQLYNICIGYANAYTSLGKLDQLEELILWLHELGKGLRDTGTVTWMDRGDVRLYIILAEIEIRRDNEAGAFGWLKKARETALQFDAAPEYRTAVGLKFYHGNELAVSYDDMGETAMVMIERSLKDKTTSAALSMVWKRVCAQGES